MGEVWLGPLKAGDTFVALSHMDPPDEHTVELIVHSIEVDGNRVEEAGAGSTASLSLRGMAHHALEPGWLLLGEDEESRPTG